MVKCPICDANVKPRSQNPSFPFCGARCKTIDLGKWVNEEYRIPVQGDEIEDGDADLEGLLAPASKTEKDVRH